MDKMKGISRCADCAYYSQKQHKCTICNNIESNPADPFYDDCSRPDVVEPPKWISVDDKLPPDDKPVLCWYEYYRYGDYNCMYRTYGIGYNINGYWGGEVTTGRDAKPLFWMPLPEPPKEEKR